VPVLRQEMRVPIIMLTARTDEVDKVVGLEVGADDYLIKPFSIGNCWRGSKHSCGACGCCGRSSPRDADVGAEMHFADLTLDLERHEAYLRGEPLALKPKEYELLVYLAQHRGGRSPAIAC
jgi:two-component system alkaline phosphatase synthesis response regulator PhoP